MGLPKIKVSTEGVIDSVKEVGTDLADRAGIGRKSQEVRAWEQVAENAAREVDWTEVTNELVNVEDKARRMIAKAEEGTQAEINEAWQQLKDASDVLKQQAIDSMNTIVKQAYDQFVQDVCDTLNDEQKKYVNSIIDVLQKLKELKEMFDIKKIIDELLNKAEELLEGYLCEKLEFLKQMDVKGIPDVNINLDGTIISFNVFIYILKIDDDRDPRQNCFAEISIQLLYDLSKPEMPKPRVDPMFYSDRVEDDIREWVEQRLEEEKDEMVQTLLEMFFSDYISVFEEFRGYLDLL
ncbi:hypothetical protein MHB71_00070 [Paenibacillus sp. FSL H7-0940]|uniref:hypothetical protein n=1 Tax=Paenibacillus sp. FSL H7-0940 TaxID=2921443 RepID=UPI0030EB3C08